MKAKNKNLGTLSYLMHQPLNKKFKADMINKFCKLAREVKDKLELLQTVETNVGEKYVPDFNGYFTNNQQKEIKQYNQEMKPIYDEEIELPDLQFSLAEWPELELTSFQLLELTELGILKEG
jgi:hypothetical protein